MIETYKINEFDTKYFISENKTIISYVIVHELYEVLDIIDVFTKKEYRRKGYSKRILSYILENTNATKIMLEVNENNLGAISLYRLFGFDVINKRKDYYKNGNALIMEVLK